MPLLFLLSSCPPPPPDLARGILPSFRMETGAAGPVVGRGVALLLRPFCSWSSEEEEEVREGKERGASSREERGEEPRTRLSSLHIREVAMVRLISVLCKNATRGADLTLSHACKGPKGISFFEKQTAKLFLSEIIILNMVIPGKLYMDYFETVVVCLKV